MLGWYEKRLDELDLDGSIKDSKTRLQEFLQSRRLNLPDYELVSVEGEAHAQTFNIQCHTVLLDNPTQGQGNSRRQAEQNAAKAALMQLRQEVSRG